MAKLDLDDRAPALIAIGDIHGCAPLLDKLLDKIERKMKDAPYQLIFLGDYVDRGEKSFDVIERLISLKEERPDTIFLKGNHEEAMLDFLAAGEAAEAWLSWGGEATLNSYGVFLTMPHNLDEAQEDFAAALPDDHFEFLQTLQHTHTHDEYLFVHAGLNPFRSLTDQRVRDYLWIREQWFDHGEGQFPDHIVVHGHTPVKKPESLPWRINVDTGAVWSSKLSAVILGGDKPIFVST